MTIGELYIKLGIEGDDKARKALENTKVGVADLSTSALEAKAAILGMIYGLERMTQNANALGTSLVNFKNSTGLDTTKLQQWQYATKQAGGSADELTTTVTNLQQKIADLRMKGTPVEGLQFLGEIIAKNKTKLDDTFGLMQDINELTQKFKNRPDLIKGTLSSLGWTQGVQNAAFGGWFNQKTFSQAPIVSDKAAKSLDNMNRQWRNMGDRFQREILKLDLKFGPDLIKDLEKITPQILRMVDAFGELVKKSDAIKWLGKAFEGWGMIFGLISDTLEQIESRGDEGDIKAGKLTDRNKTDPRMRKRYWLYGTDTSLLNDPSHFMENLMSGFTKPGANSNVTINHRGIQVNGNVDTDKIRKLHRDTLDDTRNAYVQNPAVNAGN